LKHQINTEHLSFCGIWCDKYADISREVLLWKDLLQQYSRIGGGGTRFRPEIIKAYSEPETTLIFCLQVSQSNKNSPALYVE